MERRSFVAAMFALFGSVLVPWERVTTYVVDAPYGVSQAELLAPYQRLTTAELDRLLRDIYAEPVRQMLEATTNLHRGFKATYDVNAKTLYTETVHLWDVRA